MLRFKEARGPATQSQPGLSLIGLAVRFPARTALLLKVVEVAHTHLAVLAYLSSHSWEFQAWVPIGPLPVAWVRRMLKMVGVAS
jgi:hypothetical protein